MLTPVVVTANVINKTLEILYFLALFDLIKRGFFYVVKFEVISELKVKDLKPQ